eukprot:Blabericola_migrator_1__10689@NODE_60_length_15787_cov_35_100891_g54_i0_p3_GENE_NODE_60_length_15787_cov_35_100891_g54_i0NODE_60_length_15787_cov_35_100891_g54_i0_p3_ORF_typecomplete_len562_score53_20PX/PF00787_24/1_4e14_NODE_60_length_15787_cov_35_100891_g54_i056247309
MPMDLDRLKVAITGFEPSDDGRTYNYIVTIDYGAIRWKLLRRFSAFHSLHNQLFADGLSGLPSVPSKSLTRPNDPETAQRRQKKLHHYLRSLLIRPDLRESLPVLQFLEFEDHTNTCVPCRSRLPSLGEAPGMSSRFAVSGFQFYATPDVTAAFLWVSYQDSTPFSKLGKAWSVVEPEMVGAAALYSLSVRPTYLETESTTTMAHFGYAEASDVPFTNQMVSFMIADTQVSQRLTAAAVHWFPATGESHFIAGSENGELYVLVPQPNPESGTVELTVWRCLQLHIKAKIMKLLHCGDTILSIGTDNSIKCLAIPTTAQEEYSLVSSGRVVKPLDKKEFLCTLEYVESHSIAILGTSNGKLLFYNVQLQPPLFILTFPLVPVVEALENQAPSLDIVFDEVTMMVSKERKEYKEKPPLQLPVTAICLSQHGERRIYVAADSLIIILRLDPFLDEAAPVILDTCDPLAESHYMGKLDCPLNPAYGVTAMCLDERDTSRHLLIVAHYRTLVIWDVNESAVLHCTEWFAFGKISSLSICEMKVEGGGVGGGNDQQGVTIPQHHAAT